MNLSPPMTVLLSGQNMGRADLGVNSGVKADEASASMKPGVENLFLLRIINHPLKIHYHRGLFPSTHASWPDGNKETSPGLQTCSVPSSIFTLMTPDTWYWK